jgi:glycosyltransferase involved in cell wall biosynthesis
LTATVSVIIPAYNASGTIRRAVNSVLAQTVPVLEILVIDDGSPDDVATPLAGLDPRITVIRQSNAGASAARNRGLDAARGEWVAFLDADDEWFPNRLELQLAVTREWPEVEFISGMFLLRHGDGRRDQSAGHPRRNRSVPLNLDGEAAFDFAASCWTGTVLIRRDALGNERFRTDLKTAEDREFWLRMVLQHPAYAVDHILAVQHVTMGSLSNGDIDADCANMMRVIDLYQNELGPTAARRWRASIFRRQAGVHLAQRRYRLARRAAFSRLRLDPLSLEGWWIAARSLLPDRAK